jgi:STE24 endopeptidase
VIPFHTTFFWVFLAFYLLHEIVHLSLDGLNYRHVKKQTEMPEFYDGKISPAIYNKSQAYTLEKIRFGMTAHLALIPFFWFLIFRNGFNVFDYYAATYAGFGTLSHSVLFCIFVSAYFGIVGMPFKIYSTFVIEEKYGFNKMSFGLFVLDGIKGLVLSAALGIPVLYLVFWFMNIAGSEWWLWVWFALTVFQLLIVTVYPTFLAPLFNKFQPLKDDLLNERIQTLARKIKFKISGVFIMDGSRRSGHANAYFSGMGKFRRIVLFDTLQKQLNSDEIVAVLAHEMGHNVKHHIRKFMILSTLLSLAGFYILSLLIDWPQFYSAFNISMANHHAALVIFMIASEAFTFMLTPIMNQLSRKNEYEADAFSVENTGDKKAMISSLVKLSKENLSNLNPHPAYSFYHYSHPTTIERAQAIEKI